MTFPLARHIFMYRACHKVVGSFVSLLAETSFLSLSWQRLMWWLYEAAVLPQIQLEPLQQLMASRELPIVQLSRSSAAKYALRWLESVLGWLALQVGE